MNRHRVVKAGGDILIGQYLTHRITFINMHNEEVVARLTVILNRNYVNIFANPEKLIVATGVCPQAICPILNIGEF